ncbi:hypothetical protein [Chloroflexus sp.]|uniref:hypothetical protein n=1 Tax=Chloroflexus sp. TaxID=1904827 RepID=UPI002614CFF0|nr:hypothetical protein [uncultured Chloroflexus sp.]
MALRSLLRRVYRNRWYALIVIWMCGLLFPFAISPLPGQASAQNLIQDGSFEQQGDSWEACGNVQLVDGQAAGFEFVNSGRYAVVMGVEADGSDCPQLPDLSTPRQILSQPLTIPVSAPAVTVSFWFRAATGMTIDVFLARGFYQFDPNLGGVKLGTFATDQPPGWQLYRTVLQGEQLARVRGQPVRFSIVIQGNASVESGAVLLIDDVSVIAADGRTTAAPLPPRLRGDGSRPLAVTRVSGQNRWLYRMDTDGGNVQLIYQGLVGNVRAPAWSPDGQRLVVVDHNTWPWPVPDPDPQNNLIASAVTVLNADGSGARQVYQTQSQKGSRCPFVPSAGEPVERPSFLVRLSGVQWMPDNTRIAIAQTGFGAFCNGNLAQGGRGDLLILAPPSPQTQTLAPHATRPAVHANGRILFDGFDLSSSRSNRAGGVWEIDTRTQPPGETRLIASEADRAPVWAPDGRRFAVIRLTTSPSADVSERWFAIMLYDRQNLANPRMLLFADHGRSISSLSWSPDGAYLLYTLERFDGRTDIWWLDVATGATGPITTDGNALEAVWRPGNRLFVPLVVR